MERQTHVTTTAPDPGVGRGGSDLTWTATSSDRDPTCEREEPPGSPLRAHPWQQIPAERWNDWRWQLAHRLSTVDDFAALLDLTGDEVAGLSNGRRFTVGVTPYFASLMNSSDPNCPLRRQVIPTAQEVVPNAEDMVDSLAEDAHSPVPGLVHRYPDRVLMLVTNQCASYCRFCTRSRVVGDAQSQYSSTTYEGQLAYIAATPQVRDVLISGGDPLLLSDRLLETLLSRLRAVPHVEIIRLGTRVPVFVPQRITPQLVDMQRRYHPIWMNVHFNHPSEITPEVEAALAMLADAGIPLGSQTVLLAGINDCPNVMRALVRKLLGNRVRPYYIYQCDLVQGAGHFRTPLGKGIEVIEALRGHTSGLAVPTFVIDAPDGGGKVPVLPTYLISMSDRHAVVRNFEGFISTYTQPPSYRAHDSGTCPYCQDSSDHSAQEGVAGLLAGKSRAIEPEGWRTAHARAIPLSHSLLPGTAGAPAIALTSPNGDSQAMAAASALDLGITLRSGAATMIDTPSVGLDRQRDGS
jgi:lysine 2,3-aminomutase